eukprot:320077-Pyramimonas_sp.AAC.1
MRTRSEGARKSACSYTPTRRTHSATALVMTARLDLRFQMGAKIEAMEPAEPNMHLGRALSLLAAHDAELTHGPKMA